MSSQVLSVWMYKKSHITNKSHKILSRSKDPHLFFFVISWNVQRCITQTIKLLLFYSCPHLGVSVHKAYKVSASPLPPRD